MSDSTNFLRYLNKLIVCTQRLFIRIIVLILFQQIRNIRLAEVGRVLVVKSGGLGDFLFGVPAFNLLRDRVQESDIDLLTYTSFSYGHKRDNEKKKIAGLPWLNLVEHLFSSVYVLDGPLLNSILKLRKHFKLQQYSNVILMPCPGEPCFTTIKKLFFIRALGLKKCHVHGIRQNYSTAFLRKFHEQWGLAQHKIYGPWRAVEEFLSQNIEISESYLPLQLKKISVDSKPSAIELLQRLDIDTKHYVLISPGTISEWKNWSLENYRKLVMKLAPILKEQHIAILIAGPSTDSVLAEVLKIDDNIFDICGAYTIFELAILHQESICSVAVDGGAAHLAAFSGANLVSLSNGGEEPGIVTPVGPKVVELRNLTYCTPCFGMSFCPLGHSKCIRDIKVGEVLSSIMSVVKTELKST